jgi:L-ascorbate metabolism protein UlaG (beta-lactamase superfamily)
MERDGAALVIDPGIFSEAAALDGADAVLITHEHADHLDPDKLTVACERSPQLRIYAHPSVVGQLGALGEAVEPVDVGQQFTAAGFQVKAYGGQHAEIHPDVPRIANLGYLIEGSVFHPGDSVGYVPDDATVQTLFVPINAPWLKLSESVDFVRAVAPAKAYALHDHLLSAAGAKIYGNNLAKLSGCDYQHLEPGTTI